MTRLKMHWEFVRNADGKRFLGMQWENAQAGEMSACSHLHINRFAQRKAA